MHLLKKQVLQPGIFFPAPGHPFKGQGQASSAEALGVVTGLILLKVNLVSVLSSLAGSMRKTCPGSSLHLLKHLQVLAIQETAGSPILCIRMGDRDSPGNKRR